MADKVYPQFFSAQDLGKSFREVAVDVIRTENQEILNRWYHSNRDADLFVWLDAKQNIIKQQLSFFGQVIEWNIIEGLKTGCLLEEEDQEDGGKVKGSEVVKFDLEPQTASLKQALELLRAMTVLADQDRQVLIDNFSDRKSMKSLPPEEFIRRFGHTLNRPNRKPQESFWRRYWRYLTGK